MHRVNILAKIAFDTSGMAVFLYQSSTIWVALYRITEIIGHLTYLFYWLSGVRQIACFLRQCSGC